MQLSMRRYHAYIRTEVILGLNQLLCKFLPQLSTSLAPLHYLQRKNTKCHWRRKQQAAFEASKKLLVSAEVLVHFDVKKDLILSCDASPYGVGAVLAHRMRDGSERRVAYASRSQSSGEELLPLRQKGCSGDLWSEKVSPVSVWQTFHHNYRS